MYTGLLIPNSLKSCKQRDVVLLDLKEVADKVSWVRKAKKKMKKKKKQQQKTYRMLNKKYQS